MSGVTFVLLSVLVLSTYAQSINKLGGIFNGLRYTFTVPALNIGCAGNIRPALPSNGLILNSGQLCFFIHEKVYIYATDCADTIVDRYHWTGMNATLPGGFTGAAQSSTRYVSDGTIRTLRYSYNYANNNVGVGNFTNTFFAVTTNEDASAITSFIWYYPGCTTTYPILDATYKPYTSWPIKHATYRTTNITFGGNFCTGNNNNNNLANNGVCLGSCTGVNTNQGWVNMPTVLCIDVDRYNSYKITDCVGNDFGTNYWWTFGGTPANFSGNNGNNGVNGLVNYFPYGNTNERGSWQLGLYWGASFYNGYYLTAKTACGSTWMVPLTRALDAVAQPNLTPLTGLYTLNSNVPTSNYNTWHFGNVGGAFNNGFQGGAVGWSTYCSSYRDKTLFPGFIPKNMQLCLLQTSSNRWELNDCLTYRRKVIMTFGWNGVSWTGLEAGVHPIEVSFDINGQMTGWRGIYAAGMCSYTFSVRTYQPHDAPYITNGIYGRTYTPAWDFVLGNRYYYYANTGSDWSDGNCTGLQPGDDNHCVYNDGTGMVVDSDCAGSPHNFFSWSGLMWETNPRGVEAPRRSYWWIDTSSVTPTSFTSHMVRGGCAWIVQNTLQAQIAGPHVGYGRYTKSGSTTKEGSCLPTTYDDVGIYPSGLPSMEYAIQDWATGEILLTMKWDGSTYTGFDKWGTLVTAIIDNENRVFSGIFGYGTKCVWSISYGFEADAPVLPRIQSVPAQPGWKFTDAYGIWNGILDGGSCTAEDPDIVHRYNTLVCIWPNGPAVLNIIQCNDNRDDYQTILQQAVWKGGLGRWEGTDMNYAYSWGYIQDEQNTYDEITFSINAIGNSGCTFSLVLWRGDDCETAGWKAGISVLSVFAAFLVLVVLYLFTAGGSSGGGGGYHEYQ